MNVFGVGDQNHGNHAFGFLCPLFDHEKAINKRWDVDPDQTCPIDEQLPHVLITAVRNRTINKLHRLNKRTFPAGTELADPLDDFQMLQH